jgi:hypothetical protein
MKETGGRLRRRPNLPEISFQRGTLRCGLRSPLLLQGTGRVLQMGAIVLRSPIVPILVLLPAAADGQLIDRVKHCSVNVVVTTTSRIVNNLVATT